MAKDKNLEKIESGSNMDGSNMEGTKPNIKRVKLRSPNAPEYPPRVSLGRKRIDWGKKGNTPTGKGGSGSASAVGQFGAAIEKADDKSYLHPEQRRTWSHAPEEYFPETAKKKNNGAHPTSTPYVSDDPKTPEVKPKPPEAHQHKSLQKEDGNGALDSGAGTVFTSTNAGIFTPTHGGSGPSKKVKDKKKRSGIEKLGAFLTDGSPEKKMKKKAAVLKTWVEKQQEEELPQFVEEEGKEDTSNQAVAEQLDMENKIGMINDEEKKKGDDNKPSADIVSAHITDVQLAKQPQAFGNPQDDELKRGSKKDKSRPDHEADLELADYELPEKIQKEFDLSVKQSTQDLETFLYKELWEEDEKEIPIKKAIPVYNGPPSAKYLMRI